MLRRVFGHAAFKGLQAPVIAEMLTGRSAPAVPPIGVGLVVSPLSPQAH